MSPRTVATTFTTKEGLAADAVRAIAQDREGYLWFGTAEKKDIAQFRSFSVFPVPRPLIAAGTRHSE